MTARAPGLLCEWAAAISPTVAVDNFLGLRLGARDLYDFLMHMAPLSTVNVLLLNLALDELK